MRALMEAMGYCFQNEALLRLALMHPSAAQQKGREDNQRLEFLGDAVLQLCVSRALFERYPRAREGELTRMRIALVREETLCEAAQRLNVGAHLMLDPGEKRTGGRMKPSILADAFEALLAAVYLDGGFDEAMAFASRALNGFAPPPARAGADSKSALQERLQAGGHPPPDYAILCEEGPPHDKRFTAEVNIDGRPIGTGRGKTKKEAEQQAAHAALAAMGDAL